ncbi:ribonuclease H-like protein [Basidiobolus meristosporus CBS 931.73]|uniref:3'-5' exonuclease n=1 Tax=Basidiobolus meristosporus CBS 931.73 TaxID=1314790 RepID=A0A1Y1YUE0_9FUNG|nr:ribonuclease H-like protein [Basidiobolus meristosporus CBS 931.73]|eukprot:ORY01454.1 ribonuclease H-like protein [Basidiobolus meristosporus CBS 931.73]
MHQHTAIPKLPPVYPFFEQQITRRDYTVFREFQNGVLEPCCSYDGVKIYIVSTLPELLTSLKLLQLSIKKHKVNYVGFDTEKEVFIEENAKGNCSTELNTNKRAIKKLALIQFATEDTCVLIRIPLVFKNIQEATQLYVFPTEFHDFLANEKVSKVGVSASWDSHALRSQYKLLVRGVVNLDRIAKSLGHEATSLKSLCNRYSVGIQPSDVRNKQWFNKELSKQSILYAAKDAIAGYRLFRSMKNQVDQKGLLLPVSRKRR